MGRDSASGVVDGGRMSLEREGGIDDHRGNERRAATAVNFPAGKTA